jgi:hypothetical protein
MTPKKASNEIKGLLDELLRAKAYQEKKSLLKQITPLIKVIDGPIKKLKEEEEARKAKKRIIKSALRELISTLDEVSEGRGLGGEFCEQVRDVIHYCFIKPQRHYLWPAKLGLDTDAQEESVRAALKKFLAHPEVVAASQSLKNPEDRLLAFQDTDVKTSMGSSYFSYFGYINKPQRLRG